MRPDVQFKNANFSNYGEPIHQVSCEIDGVSFVAQGNIILIIYHTSTYRHKSCILKFCNYINVT